MAQPTDGPADVLQQAITHHRAGRLQQAEQIYRSVLAREPGNTEAMHLLGMAAFQTGHHDPAAELIAKAVAASPDNPKYHYNLGRVRRAQSKLEDAAESFQRTIELAAGTADAHSNLGAVLAQLDRAEEAIASLHKAIELEPRDESAHTNLGHILQNQGKFDEATDYYRRAISLRPGFLEPLYNLGRIQLKTGKPAQALESLDQCLAEQPFDRRALAWRAVALSELGRTDEAAATVDPERDVAVLRLDQSSPDADPAALNHALVEELADHPALEWEPAATTTRGGSQIGKLLNDPSEAVETLEWHLRATIDGHLAGLESDASPAYMRAIPRSYILHMWATVLSEQGHQLTHNHPAGWLSGVYYVRVPGITASADDHAGWIEFGRPRDDVPTSFEPQVRLIAPEEGMVALFPSYLFHRTIPFAGPDKRISIAFDLCAKR
jgi:uncharacterized protein (TIGR02466 family)